MSRSLSDQAFAAYVSSALSALPGVQAVMLGGSRAYGQPGPETDWDFSLYYQDHFDVEELRALAWSGQVFALGGWGGGVFNGGAWQEIDGRRVDIHYRDLNDVERRIADAERGQFAIEYPPFYLAGIPTYVVVAELALGQVLTGELPRPSYPEALRRSASARWQGNAEMTLTYAEAAYGKRGDTIGVAGAAARALLEASHARLAARGQWVTNEKTLISRANLAFTAACFEGLSADPAKLCAFIAQLRDAIRPA